MRGGGRVTQKAIKDGIKPLVGDYIISKGQKYYGDEAIQIALNRQFPSRQEQPNPSIVRELLSEVNKLGRLDLESETPASGKISLDFERGLVTKKAIDSPEFSNALSEKIKKEIEGVTTELVTKLSAGIKESSEVIKDTNKTLIPLSEAVKAAKLDQIIPELKAVAPEIKALRADIANTAQKIQDENDIYADRIKALRADISKMGNVDSIKEEVRKMSDEIKQSQQATSNVADILQSIATDIGELTSGVQAKLNFLPVMAAEIRTLRDQYSGIFNAQRSRAAPDTAENEETQALAQSAAEAAEAATAQTQ